MGDLDTPEAACQPPYNSLESKALPMHPWMSLSSIGTYVHTTRTPSACIPDVRDKSGGRVGDGASGDMGGSGIQDLLSLADLVTDGI